MNEQTHPPLEAGQDHLSTMPPEILREVLKPALDASDQQIIPNPMMRISKKIGLHVAGLLTEHCTLQLQCRLPVSHYYWATSMYRSWAKGGYLRAPDLPSIKGSAVRWSNFRDLLFCAEMLDRVDSVYIKLNWMRGLAFTVLFHPNQPPTITTHPWFPATLVPELRPSMTRWIQQPARCSVQWIEAFIDDMRNQCDAHVAQYYFSREVYLYRMALGEMACRQPWQKYAVVLKPVNPRNTKPKMFRVTEAIALRNAFISQDRDRHKAEVKREKELDERFERFQLLERRGRSSSVPVRGKLSGTRVRSTSI
ncbi:hypothetical protein KCV07_g4757, partial [Aureobasidium melanogenum]